MTINVKFDIYVKRDLGTLFKSNEVDLDGLEANVNLDLDLVESMKVNYLINGNKLTDDIAIKDIEKRLILIPFKSEVRVTDTKIKFEIQANMKNGDVKVSQTYVYDVEMGIGEGTQVGTGGSGDGHTHNNLSTLHKITEAKIKAWDAKSDFSGSYNDLTNKPTIPTVDVTKVYVDGEVSKKADRAHSHSEYATPSYVQEKIAEASLSGGGSNNILNKIEILENDPVDGLFEGRIWVVVNNNVSTPVISLHSYKHNSITIKLDVASYNPVYGKIETYELYNNDVLLESEVINVSQGGTYKINNLTSDTTYNIKLKGILNNNKSEFSNTVNVTTQHTPQAEDIPTNGLAVRLKGSDFTNSPQTTVLYDLSGNDNHATANGFDYTINSGSDGNGNIVFDGSGDKIVIPKSESISATNGFTIVFKGSINDLSQSNKEVVDMLINHGNSTTGAQISLIYGYISNTFELYGNKLPLREGSQITINDTNIHTIIYTYDGATLCGYLDGVEVVNVSKSVSITLPIQSTSIGASSNNNSFAKIKLRHYLFYNRGLTADEVAAVENGLL